MLWDPLFDRIAELTGSPADQCKVGGRSSELNALRSVAALDDYLR